MAGCLNKCVSILAHQILHTHFYIEVFVIIFWGKATNFQSGMPLAGGDERKIFPLKPKEPPKQKLTKFWMSFYNIQNLKTWNKPFWRFYKPRSVVKVYVRLYLSILFKIFLDKSQFGRTLVQKGEECQWGEGELVDFSPNGQPPSSHPRKISCLYRSRRYTQL